MFKAFPKIPSLVNLAKDLSTGRRPLPEQELLVFYAHPKMHGTNAAIGIAPDGTVFAQSRNRIITPGDDNHGFAAFVASIDPRQFVTFADAVAPDRTSPLYIFGEWVGKGIGKGTALNTLEEKLFIPFLFAPALPAPGAQFLADISPRIRPLRLLLDLARLPRAAVPPRFMAAPDDALLAFVLKHTERWGERCPVAAALGIEGPGEGIVWHDAQSGMTFKTKAAAFKEEEQRPAAPKQPRGVEVCDVSYLVTVGRMTQAVEFLREQGHPVDRTSTRYVVEWVRNDVTVEEGITNEQELRQIGRVAAAAFITMLNEGLS